MPAARQDAILNNFAGFCCFLWEEWGSLKGKINRLTKLIDNQTIYRIGEDYKKKGFYLLAADIIKKALKPYSNDNYTVNMKIVLADCLRIIKRWDEAIEVYKDINDFGTVGNIFLYLGNYEESIKWYELVRKHKYYVYNKHPQVLFLVRKYTEALDLICEKYYIETKDSLIKNHLPTKGEFEFILLCFQQAYNLHEHINTFQENYSQIELLNYLDGIILNQNEKSYKKHQGLLRATIKGFGNLPTTLINLEQISTEKYFAKAKAKMSTIYYPRPWCLKEISDQNIFSPKGLVNKIVDDEKFAKDKLQEINNEFLSEIKRGPYYNWYNYVQKKNSNGEDINGTDIVKYFNYFLPKLSIVQLFEEEVIEFINDRINAFNKENNETLCSYLANYLTVPSDFYIKSDSIMFNLFSSIDNYLKQTLGLADHNEKWIKEFAMVKLFYKWFEGFKQITQASPEWLKPQRLDLFIPDLKLAVEYQGEQHFMPIEIFGGEGGFQERKENDERKWKLCEANGVNLEYINYDEDLLERVKEIYAKYYPSIKNHILNINP